MKSPFEIPSSLILTCLGYRKARELWSGGIAPKEIIIEATWLDEFEVQLFYQSHRTLVYVFKEPR